MHTKAICGKLKQQCRLAQTDAYLLEAYSPWPLQDHHAEPAMIVRASSRKGARSLIGACGGIGDGRCLRFASVKSEDRSRSFCGIL